MKQIDKLTEDSPENEQSINVEAILEEIRSFWIYLSWLPGAILEGVKDEVKRIL